MSLPENKTFALWKSFMPRLKEITKRKSNEMFSLQVYNEPIRLGDSNQEFEKWALVEVSNFENMPIEMETFDLESGLYAVFHYKPELDERPHFEILGEKYKNDDPNSEEEIWIPIRNKNNPHLTK